MNKKFSRVMSGLALLASALFLPWWTTAALAVVFLLYFDSYFEVVVAGFLLDAAYGLEIGRFWGFQGVATVASGIAFLVSMYAKSKLRYYR